MSWPTEILRNRRWRLRVAVRSRRRCRPRSAGTKWSDCLRSAAEGRTAACRGQVSGCCLSCAITSRWAENLPFIAAGIMKRNPYQISVPSGRRSSSGSASSVRSVRAFGRLAAADGTRLARIQRQQKRLVVRILSVRGSDELGDALAEVCRVDGAVELPLEIRRQGDGLGGNWLRRRTGLGRLGQRRPGRAQADGEQQGRKTQRHRIPQAQP